MGFSQRISQIYKPEPHFPCHITSTEAGLFCWHGSECAVIPWDTLRPIWEQANPKLKPTPPPKPEDMQKSIEYAKVALAEAAKLNKQ
jgi:hypothetical protein